MTVTDRVTIRINGSRILVQGKMQTLIESRSNPGQFHTVEFTDNKWYCTCPSGTIRKRCWHIDAIRGWLAGGATVTVE